MRTTIALTALLLTGCAAPGYWVSDTHNSASQFERDRKQCEYEAYAAEPLSPIIRESIGRKCLAARGYTWQTGEMPKDRKIGP